MSDTYFFSLNSLHSFTCTSSGRLSSIFSEENKPISSLAVTDKQPRWKWRKKWLFINAKNKQISAHSMHNRFIHKGSSTFTMSFLRNLRAKVVIVGGNVFHCLHGRKCSKNLPQNCFSLEVLLHLLRKLKDLGLLFFFIFSSTSFRDRMVVTSSVTSYRTAGTSLCWTIELRLFNKHTSWVWWEMFFYYLSMITSDVKLDLS